MIERIGLVHDAGNLLSALRLYADLLAFPGVLSGEHREYADEIRVLSERSDALLKRLVKNVQADDVSGEVVIIPDVLDRCQNLVNRILGRSIEFTYSTDSFSPVHVSSEIVERILVNLLKNASEATPADKAISVSVAGIPRSNGELLIAMTVTDDGMGLSRSDLEKFLSSSRRNKNGHGYGLRIIRELVKRSDGSIEVESYPGRGTRVSVMWPSHAIPNA
jgi:signal transduction histidine kinase